MSKSKVLLGLVLSLLALVISVASTQGKSMFSFDFKRLVNKEQLSLIREMDTDISCSDIPELRILHIYADSVAIEIVDTTNSKWEVFLQEDGLGIPTSAGVSVTTKFLTLNKDQFGKALEENFLYEIYVRSVCAKDTWSAWSKRTGFQTTCGVTKTYPFSETFNSDSLTKNCWEIMDEKGESKPISGAWEIYKGSTHEGDGVLYFNKEKSNQEDWLLSPSFLADQTAIYQITYYYRSAVTSKAKFEFLYAVNGRAISDFKYKLQDVETHRNSIYKKKTHYLSGVSGEITLGWHVMTEGQTRFYIDSIRIEKVNCVAPREDEIEVSQVQADEFTVSWKDQVNKKWEYLLLPMGTSLPASSGSVVTKNSVRVKSTNGTSSATLQENTTYDFYLRTQCAGGYSEWIGPIGIHTACQVKTLPFEEDFELTSLTWDCWSEVDLNQDGSSSKNKWNLTKTANYEGTQSVFYKGDIADDWLISPTFSLDITKVYELSFYYRTDNSVGSDFDVAFSTKGNATVDFEHILVAKRNEADNTWKKQSVYVSKVGGPIRFGWHIFSAMNKSSLYIDKVKIQEVNCPAPVQVSTVAIGTKSLEFDWQDTIGNSWEYVLYKAGTPHNMATATSLNKKNVVVSKDADGDVLVPNTAYDFYVRTRCDSTNFGQWIGPIKVQTRCEPLKLPFWEGFNSQSDTFSCWVIQDVNNDGNSSTGKWIKTMTNTFEGNTAMLYKISDSNQDIKSDDYLISPTFSLDKSKVYRLRYNYRANFYDDDNRFSVLASTSGIEPSEFTHKIVEAKAYTNEEYQEKKAFLSDLKGEVNIAWHIEGVGNKTVYIDNVFIEEVVGCPEPVALHFNEVKSTTFEFDIEDNFKAVKWDYVVIPALDTIPSTFQTTSKKKNFIDKDSYGNSIQSNTEYKVYVRTICKDGSTSIWGGPYPIVTTCAIYPVPFWEGFNSNSLSKACWTIVDGNGDGTPYGNQWLPANNNLNYEGDGSVFFSGFTQHDDWLITPKIETEASMYMLKYHTNANIGLALEMELKLSYNGPDVKEFTEVISPRKVYKSNGYKEDVVFFTAKKGQVNLAWHVVNNGGAYANLDNVSIKKVETCPEPYYVTITNASSSTIDLEWQQDTGIQEWEVILVKHNDKPTDPILKKVTVKGTNNVHITGLNEGEAYTAYVRAVCITGGTYSDWSSGKSVGTYVNLNDECSGAKVIPVNDSVDCMVTVEGSLYGATSTPGLANPSCGGNYKADVWFEFTPKRMINALDLTDLISMNNMVPYPRVDVALYEGNCATVSNTALGCKTFTTYPQKWMLPPLEPNKKYYLRVGSPDDVADLIFKMCLTSSVYEPLIVSPSGDKYSVEELVKEVLISSNCDLISNVNFQVGDGSAATQAVNTLGYFEKGNSIFPFEKGIVLGTGEIDYVPGPYQGDSGSFRGNNPHRWIGDKDINDAIEDAGGGDTEDKRVTQLEFDFIPVKDSIKFDYLFTSNSYTKGCGYSCKVGALFAAWLVDTTTGEGINLAKIKDTAIPIALNTIRDQSKSGIACGSEHPEYYWKHYENGVDAAIDAPIDFVGFTKAMSSETVSVVPGRKYHIKLAVMDFCTLKTHTSAVFFNAGSFDIGNLNLGSDLLVETNNALCNEESYTIYSGIGIDTEGIEITWYKDNVEIQGEKNTSLTITDPGFYQVIGIYKELNCQVEGQIRIEKFPKLSESVEQPQDLPICRYSLTGKQIVDLTTVETTMFKAEERSFYAVSYFTDKERTQRIEKAEAYETTSEKRIIYIEVEDVRIGCREQFEFTLIPSTGSVPEQPNDVIVCDRYVLPKIKENEHYYTAPGAKGIQYEGGDVLLKGKHHLYLMSRNEQQCYEEVSFTVEVVEKPELKVIADVEMECDLYVLEELPENNSYYTENQGTRVKLKPGTIIKDSGTVIYVVAESEGGTCYEESQFTITYLDCPIPRGFSPNGDGINDTFDLSNHGVSSLKIFNRDGRNVYSHGKGYTNQWEGKDRAGNQLPSGTYYYIIEANYKTRTGWVEINR